MIQRIQSIFLLLGGIVMGLLLSGLFKIGKLKEESDIVVQAAASTSFADGKFTIDDQLILVLLTILGVALALGAIFLYKNRPLQIKVTRIFIFVALAVNGLAFYLMYREYQIVQENVEVNLAIGAGAFMPLAALILAYLALRNIEKDDKLVKSMDRLR